jgi:aminotransferase
VVVVADEVYARLRYDDKPPVTLLAHAPDHVVSLGSASKEYLLPGARVGYVVSRHVEITDRILRRMIRASSASANVLGQEALVERLGRDLEDMRAGREPALLGEVRRHMWRRRDALLEVLHRQGMSPAGRAPEGTIFLMASLPAWWDGDDVAFCERALTGGWFSAIPGTAFSLPGAFRLSFGALSLDDIQRLDAAFSAMRAAVP